jgi:hypothetical protein
LSIKERDEEGFVGKETELGFRVDNDSSDRHNLVENIKNRGNQGDRNGNVNGNGNRKSLQGVSLPCDERGFKGGCPDVQVLRREAIQMTPNVLLLWFSGE